MKEIDFFSEGSNKFVNLLSNFTSIVVLIFTLFCLLVVTILTLCVKTEYLD